MPPSKITTRWSLSSRLLLGMALIAVSSPALAHGEEVLVSIGLQVLSFFACLAAISRSKALKTHWLAATAGAMVGLATFFWPLGAIPYRANSSLINSAAILACPLFMFGAYSLAKWVQGHPSR